MDIHRLPEASGEKHAAAFSRLGWTRSRMGGRNHIIMHKPGNPAVLSIPNHLKVKRLLLAGLLKRAGVGLDEYLAAFGTKPRLRAVTDDDQ